MKRGEQFGEKGPGREPLSGPKYEGQIEFDMDEIQDEWLTVRKLIAADTATFEPKVGKDDKIKSITVRDKMTGKVIFFSDMEFLRSIGGNLRGRSETLGN